MFLVLKTFSKDTICIGYFSKSLLVTQASGKPEVVVRPPRSPSPSPSTAEEDKNLLKAPEGSENLWQLLPVCMTTDN